MYGNRSTLLEPALACIKCRICKSYGTLNPLFLSTENKSRPIIFYCDSMSMDGGG